MTRTVVVTGASSGIGAAAARLLRQRGDRVVVVGRSPHRTAQVAAALGADHLVADFARLDDVRALADRLAETYPRIDVLANNAGGAFGDPVTTVDGFETTFQVNHLAPFLLTIRLLATLEASQATVLQTASVAAGLVRSFDAADVARPWPARRAYSFAKLENVLFTMELHRRFHARGINAVAFHPGNVATRFATTTTSRLMRFVATNRITRSALISPDEAARELVWFATGTSGVDWTPGAYHAHRTPKTLRAATPANATALWDETERLLARH